VSGSYVKVIRSRSRSRLQEQKGWKCVFLQCKHRLPELWFCNRYRFASIVVSMADPMVWLLFLSEVTTR